MPVQIVGNQPTTAIPYTPRAEPINNPQVFSRIREPSARNWNSLGSPTNLPDFHSRPSLSLSERLSGRSPAQLSPQVQPVSPASIPSGNPNLSARLAGRSPSIVPEAIPTTPIRIPEGARSAIGKVAGSQLSGELAGLGIGLAYGAYDEFMPRSWRLMGGDPTVIPAGIADVVQAQLFRDGAPSLPDLGRLPRDLARAFGLDHPRGIPDTSRSPRSPANVVPFQGGQSGGVNYTVSLNIQSFDGFGNPLPVQPGSVTTLGPIGGLRVSVNPTGAFYIFEVSSGGVWSSFSTSTRRTQDGSILQPPELQINNIQRLDGQPDTGGNPAPIPDPNGRRRPALGNGLYIIATPSYTPTAVPLNNPQILPIGSLAAEPQKAIDPLSPASTIAPKITPEQLKRVLPNSLAPDGVPNPAIQPRPHTGLSIHSSLAGGRLGQEGQYGQTLGDYFGSITPAATAPGISGDTGTIPGFVPALAVGGALLGGYAWYNFNQSQQQATPAPPATPGTGTGSTSNNFTCRFHEDTVSHSKLDQENTLIRAIDAAQTVILNKIDSKLGDAIPNGGIAGKLGRMAELGSKTWNFLQVDRILSVMSWIGILHNAYMLSSNLSQTLFSLISNGLQALGIHKTDADGNESPFDINAEITKYTDNFAKGVFGVDNWEGIKKEWKALNRIYQAATNLLYSLQSIAYSMAQVMQTTHQYIGKIGNALQKSGTILQNSFNWMNPDIPLTENRFFSQLTRVTETVSNLDQIAAAVLSIRQVSAELFDQKNEFEKGLSEGVKNLTDSEKKAKADSTRPNLVINPVDEQKGES